MAMNVSSALAEPSLGKLAAWLKEVEDLVVVEYGYKSGSSPSIYLIRSVEDFKVLCAKCSTRTMLILFRSQHLPIRGVVDDRFIQKVRCTGSDGECWVAYDRVFFPDELIPFASADTIDEFLKELGSLTGREKIVGKRPQWDDSDWLREHSADVLVLET